MTDLRAIAEAADYVYGEYIGGWYSDKVLLRLVDDDELTAFEPQEAAHIAAWSPDRALAALDVIEAARVLAGHPRGGDMGEWQAGVLRLLDALARWEALA